MRAPAGYSGREERLGQDDHDRRQRERQQKTSVHHGITRFRMMPAGESEVSNELSNELSNERSSEISTDRAANRERDRATDPATARSWDRIVSTRMKWMTSSNPPSCKPTAAPGTVAVERLNGVRGATWIITARRRKQR